ncbi:hypothetical protein G6F47_001768 [Rhizopus delemar]|nr:hypothetical protein G6F54_003743 [Rhizopus delemar]KAG1514078.1 hypothetical protein G6F53_003952 [Rhizopus delemar]KAG1603510.1 hypothetical protein G6F47_001768 [Rhizopus delemar]
MFCLAAVFCGLFIGGCAGFAAEAVSSIMITATWGPQPKQKKEQEEVEEDESEMASIDRHSEIEEPDESVQSSSSSLFRGKESITTARQQSQPVLIQWISPIKTTQEPLICSVNVTVESHASIIPSIIEHDTCFEFASLIHTSNKTVATTFHTHWASKTFSEQQLNTIRSFLYTQPPSSKLIVWIFDEGPLKQSKYWQAISSDNRVQLRMIDNNDDLTRIKSNKDLLRLTILYRYGGVWFDLDVLFIRDLSPLLDREWMSQGSCFENSHYLCEMISTASITNNIYSRVYDRYLTHGIKPWAILPWCYADPSQCDTGMPGAFQSVTFDKNKLSNAFVYRLHPSWWQFSYGSVYKYLVGSFK